MESGLYDFKIKAAYLIKSQHGATGVVLDLEGPNGSRFSPTTYVTNRKGETTYADKQDKTKVHHLPGFNQMNAVSLLALGKPLSELEPENKVVNIYSYEHKKDVPTEVEMLVELIDLPITMGIMKIVEDKNKNVAGPGETPNYQPTGEVRTVNEIDKVFRTEDGLTVPEVLAEETEAKFKDDWSKKNTGRVYNKAKHAGAGASTGTPAAAAKPTSLFAAKPQ
jgi:hypothetical protein